MRLRIKTELVLLCACVMGLPFASLPPLVKPCNTSQFNSCVNNLRIIDSGKEQWALAKGKHPGDCLKAPPEE